MSRRQNRPAFFATSALLVSALCIVAAAKTIYVDYDATGTNNGTSWTNAYVYLQDALADADTGDKPVEIRIAQGIYKPDQGSSQTPGDSRVSFRLINDVTIRGGYVGLDKPDPNDRDIKTYETILSGDLSGNDVYVNDACDLLDEPTRFDNSWNVVDGSNTDATAVLDGFTITGGHITIVALGGPAGGAGILVYSGSPTLFDCTFTGNATSQVGGGMYNRDNSHPTLVNCTFAGNYANSGGGMCNMPGFLSSEGSDPILINCTFDNNCARQLGGGMYNFRSNPTLTDCTFSRNRIVGPYSRSRVSLTGVGGGIYNNNSNSMLTDCTFIENSAGGGGGICNDSDSSLTLSNCKFVGNSASQAGAGLLNPEDSTLTLTNCRFINNTVTGIGGGVWNGSTNATLVDCVFSGNSAHDGQIPYVSEIIPGSGGGMIAGGTPTLIRCTFRSNYATNGAGIIGGGELAECTFVGNSASKDGGAIHTIGEPIITNCTFSGNSANRGGGIFFTWGAKMTMANCTFAGNSASTGNALASDPHLPSLPGYFQLTNCILWDGEDAIFDPDPYALRSAITYSNIQGGWPGEGNININPNFADPGYWADANDPNIAVEPNDPNAVWVDGDYHLKSEAGRWNPNSESWVKDDVTSPCIDAGDPNSDWTSETWPHGGRINMGAYGGTREASMSTQPQEMTLPSVAYIHEREVEAAESYQSLLVSYGCLTTLIGLDDVVTTPLDSYDLVIVGHDTGMLSSWGESDSVAAIDNSGKPILGLGEGGYAFFGKLDLEIGWPNGMHGSRDSIEVIDPNNSLFSVPYAIDVPDDRVLQLYTETEHVDLHLWPMPETVTALGKQVESHGYYPLALEHDRYVLWGFTASPDNMTQLGKDLFINVVIRTANAAW
ncbi:MAG: hypothetical protein CEE38_02990 [Planctomycetes bacterium B3_Pla]|nr:MAG: hypothetical protein CEE38_02990 [Planctomycetes bacterium B3_Pla]